MEEKFTSELLSEVKAQAKRWFIAFCIMVGLEAITILGFIVYESLPVDDEVVTVESSAGHANYIGKDMSGVINNGEDNSETDPQSEEEQAVE